MQTIDSDSTKEATKSMMKMLVLIYEIPNIADEFTQGIYDRSNFS